MPEYKAREKQRAGERKIRSLKRELVCLDEGIKSTEDPKVLFELRQALENEAVKLKAKEASLADFCNQTGLKRDRFREQMFCEKTENGIKAWTKSVSSKAVWGNKKALDRNIERDIIKEIKSAGIKGKIILGADGIISSYSFDSNHINRERNHKVNNEEAIQFVGEAKFIAVRWEGRFRNYYGEHGAVYVDVEKENIRTAFKAEEFDDKIKAAMGVLKRYGR